MRQYTTPEQTDKLIELGFEKPKSAISISWDVPEDDGIMINANSIEYDFRYSIGELIEMLGFALTSICYIGIVWVVNAKGLQIRSVELIDALYEMIVTLKGDDII